METTSNGAQPSKGVKKSKPAKEAPRPIHTISERSVVASIWRRQTPTGYHFFEFSLARAWKSQASDRVGSSSNFFATNRDDLSVVVAKATAWIRDHEEAESSPSGNN